jgi:hypothetical protein
MPKSTLILPNGKPVQEKNAPKPTDFWDIDREKMDVLVEKFGDAGFMLYLKDAEVATHMKTGEEFPQYTVRVKWDGCVDLYYKSAQEEGLDEYNHICDLEQYIERLMALHTIAKVYFEKTRGEWPG